MVGTEDLGEKVDKAVHSEDEPLEKRRPAAPLALVGLSYMLVLALCALALAAFFWLR